MKRCPSTTRPETVNRATSTPTPSTTGPAVFTGAKGRKSSQVLTSVTAAGMRDTRERPAPVRAERHGTGLGGGQGRQPEGSPPARRAPRLATCPRTPDCDGVTAPLKGCARRPGEGPPCSPRPGPPAWPQHPLCPAGPGHAGLRPAALGAEPQLALPGTAPGTPVATHSQDVRGEQSRDVPRGWDEAGRLHRGAQEGPRAHAPHAAPQGATLPGHPVGLWAALGGGGGVWDPGRSAQHVGAGLDPPM